MDKNTLLAASPDPTAAPFVAALPHAVFTLSPNATLTYANAAACALLQMPPEAIVGAKFHALNLPRELGQAIAKLRESATRQTGAAVADNHFFMELGACGTTVDLLLYADGAAAIMIRQAAAPALPHAVCPSTTSPQFSMAHLAAMAESTRDALLLVDATGAVCLANAAARARVKVAPGAHAPSACEAQWTLSDMTGSPLAPEQWPLVQLLRGEAVHNLRLRITHKESGTAWVGLFQGRPIVDNTGVLQGAVLNMADVSEQCTLERTMAGAEEHKRQLLAMFGHELRNPLATLYFAAEMLARGLGEASPLQRYHQTLVRQSRHLKKMIDDLLELSLVSWGKVTLQQDPVDLNELATSCIRAVQPQTESAQVGLQFAASNAPLWIQGDRARLTQVVHNLLCNAIKYTPAGGLIEVSTAPARHDTEATLRVCDNGVGIAADFLPHVFDLFSQANTSADRPYGGLGVGLTLAHKIIELHGGSLQVASQGVGLGSQFTVTLPLAPPPPR